MVKLIEITGVNGTKGFINVDRLDGFFEATDDEMDMGIKTHIFVGGSDSPYEVKESVDEIVKKMTR